jgi:hypothetical protein
MGIAVMSLKSDLIRRELGKDEQLGGLFPCSSLYALDFEREGDKEKFECF